LSPNSFSKVLTWSTGDTSAFAFNQVATTVGGNTVVTLTGVITQGLFEPGLMDRFNVVTSVITSG
jgi:hypothetical protein